MIIKPSGTPSSQSRIKIMIFSFPVKIWGQSLVPIRARSSAGLAWSGFDSG